MQMSDNVRVRASGRRARTIEDLGRAHYRVVFYEEPAAGALDRDTPEQDDCFDLEAVS